MRNRSTIPLVGGAHPTWLIAITLIITLAGCESTDSDATPNPDEDIVTIPVPEPINYDRPNFDALWDYNDPAGTEAKFEQIRVEAQAAKDWAYLGELLTQIARAQGLQRYFDAAHHTLNTAEDLIKVRESVSYVRYLLERGRVYNSSNQPQKARPLFLEAWQIASALIAQDPKAEYHAVDAAHMLGIVDKGRAALAWDERAIAMAERARDPRAHNWLGSLYNNTGWTYHDLGDYDRALELFQAALAFREAQGEGRTTQIARWCVARCLRSLDRVGEALKMQQVLLKELEAADIEDGYVYEELGECLLALDRPDEAQPHFAKAFALLSQDPWLVDNEPKRLLRLKELSTGEQPQDQ